MHELALGQPQSSGDDTLEAPQYSLAFVPPGRGARRFSDADIALNSEQSVVQGEGAELSEMLTIVPSKAHVEGDTTSWRRVSPQEQ
jgi:hypothetical protein